MLIRLKILFSILLNLLSRRQIVLVSEPDNWVINVVAKELREELNKIAPNLSRVSFSPLGLRNKIVHFCSVNTLIGGQDIRYCHKSNKIILTWYHVIDNDKRIALIPKLNEKVDLVHTACDITYNKLVKYGFDKEKVVIIPESIDLRYFSNYQAVQKDKIKERLKLPENKIIIGSFQKDGVGWGEGLEPKLVKGPDIFCDIVEKLSKTFPIHVLLTGPARGYVKNKLKKAGVSFTHHYLKNYLDIVDYYNTLDLYLITSREEGGPKAILESWACGVPVISTKVGMAPDVIKDGENGVLIDRENTAEILVKISAFLVDDDKRTKMVQQALLAVRNYNNAIIANKYYDLIYKIRLIND